MWLAQIIIPGEGKWDKFIIALPWALHISVAVFLNLLIIYFIGKKCESRKPSRSKLKKQYKFPIYFIFACILLGILMFIDPTCS